MTSSGIREKLMVEERKRIAAEAEARQRREALEKLDQGVAAGALDADAARRAREIMGFA
jgi:hypothetical protein